MVPIGLLAVAGWLVSSQSKLVHWLGHGLFICLALAAGFHWLPGFHNLRLFGPTQLTPNAVSYTVYLNLDKILLAFWIFWFWPHVQVSPVRRIWIKLGLSVCGLTAAICACLAISLGVIEWAPKWPSIVGFWAIHNLLCVSFVEAVIFFGYCQEVLKRCLVSDGPWPAILIAAGLFGLMHFISWQWVLLTGIAGIGYGMAYHYGKLQAAVLSQFCLNFLQFSLFTYPMLAAQA